MDKILELKKHLKSMTLDAEKFFLKKNNSAGIRARKKLQKIKKISQDIRNFIQNVKFKFVQKKAKIKAAQAVYFGKNILSSEKFRLRCLRENKLKTSKVFNLTGHYIDEKKNNREILQKIPINSCLETLLDSKNPAPIPVYSIFNYNN
jgi:hypothetical protein